MRIARGLALALALPGLLCAQAKHAPTLDETLSLKTINSPKISPDGRYVAYRMREANWKDNEYVSQIWIANVNTGASFQLTRGKKSAGQQEWSPDGHWLAFVTERETSAIEPLSIEKKEEKPEQPAEKKGEKKEEAKEEGAGGKQADRQIWVISPEGGEAWQLTKSETNVEGFHWSKDGKSITFLANPLELKVSKDRKEKYSEYDVYEKDYRQNQLWVVDVAIAAKGFLPAAAKELTTDSSLNINSFAWSPDSTRIAFSATKNPLLAFSGEEDIYLLDLGQGNSVKKVVALPGPDGSPMFSPDGKQLAFGTALAQPYFYYTNGHIAVVNLDVVLAKPATSAADVRDLTAKFDEDVHPLDWGPDGIYFAAQQKTNAHVYRVSPASLAIQRLSSPDTLLIEDGSFTADFKTAAFITEDPTHMTELYVSAHNAVRSAEAN
jgi:Tol biopolymer transport system component